ncbi:MAG: DUF5011 domain-containing protein [candidate division SR1 bacterium]|nr:DUF5011 domain-containing protein [candidate division SR1 bacterium]
MKKILFKSLTFLIAIMGIFLYTQVFANGSDIDPSFDTKTPVGFNGTIYAHVVQSDGKIIVGGDFTTYQGIPAQYLIRLNSDGTKDASFTAYTGISTVKTMAIQSDGKLLVGGWISYSGIGATGKRIYRLNTNGSLDSSFTSSNTIRLANNILIESDGKILVAGSYGANYNSRVDKVFRLNTDGSTNNSSLFSASNSRSIQTIVLQYDGKILLEQEDPFGGSNTYATIVRLNTGGSVDTSFVSYGFNTPGRVKSLAMQSDGKILVGGDFYTYSGVDARSLMRLNTNGTRDFTFTSYIFNVAGPYTVAIQNDGKILVGGRFTTYSGVSANSIVRLNSDGTRDSSFVIGNGFDSNTNSITSQSDGKILIDGVFTTYNGSSAKGFIRLNTDGTKDTSLSMGDGFDASVKAIVVQNDGQVLIGGSFVSYSGVAANGVVRLDSNGNRDSTFNVQSGHMIIVNDIAIQNDGKILIGGNTNSTDRPGLIRLNADGSIDTSFSVSGENTGLFKFPLCVSKVVVQSNNKIITTSCNADEMYSEIPNNVLRLNTDGSIDHSFAGYRFSQNGGAGTVWIYALAVQNDGKILIGGQFNTYGGVGANGIIRLNTNGTIDTGFLMGSGFAYASYQEPMDFGGEGTREYNTTISNVKDIVIQDDGKILIGGNFTAYNLITGVNYIVRLTTNGVTDTTFVTAEGFNNPVYDISLQSGNKILAAGQFTSYDNQSSKNIALLNTDGTRNPAINSYGIDARVLTRRNDGEVLVGGGFSIYNGSAVGYLVSLYGESDLVILPDSTNTGTVVAEFTDKGYTQVNQDLVGSKSISLILTTGNIPLELNLVNQDIKLTIPADTQFLEGTSQTYYSGIISVAIPKTMTSISSLPVLSAFKVGSSSTPLDLSGGEATLLVPTPTENIGNLVQIYYSEDNGVTWYSQGLTTVGDNNGYPYVTFTTDHFTDFAVAAISGSFLINNGATATNTNAVTLNIRTTPAAKMRFSNDNSTRSNWETYGTITGRTLLAGVGEKTVYAEFDVDNDNVADISTSDIILYDATAPTGTIAYLPASGTMTNGDVVATITLNETGTVTSIGGNIHTFTGNGSFTFTFQDEAGNTGNATASVNRIDKEGPTVTLNGSSTITLSYGNSYTEAGATRTDTYDGIGNATISGLVNTGIIGTYILEYSHIDTAGNTGNTVTRTIHVVDTIAPIVTLNGDVTVTVEYGNEYSESGATRTDNYDGTGDATISGTINTGALGTYLVDYFYIDTAGNTGNIVTRTIHIVDTTAPIVILNGDVTVTVEYGNEYSESGATRSDIYDGTGDATISGGVNTGIIGTYCWQYRKYSN